MEPHVEQIVQEQDALQEKVDKLAKFLDTETFKLLDEDERRLLKLQHYHMTAYSVILQVRLRAYGIGVITQ